MVIHFVLSRQFHIDFIDAQQNKTCYPIAFPVTKLEGLIHLSVLKKNSNRILMLLQV